MLRERFGGEERTPPCASQAQPNGFSSPLAACGTPRTASSASASNTNGRSPRIGPVRDARTASPRARRDRLLRSHRVSCPSPFRQPATVAYPGIAPLKHFLSWWGSVFGKAHRELGGRQLRRPQGAAQPLRRAESSLPQCSRQPRMHDALPRSFAGFGGPSIVGQWCLSASSPSAGLLGWVSWRAPSPAPYDGG